MLHTTKCLGAMRPVCAKPTVLRTRSTSVRVVVQAASKELAVEKSAVSKAVPSGPEMMDPTTQQSGDFELKVKRKIKSNIVAAIAHSHVAAAPAAVAEPIISAAAAVPFSMEESVDESLIYVTSPKVGIFRAGRYAGGKRVGKANCVNKGDQVKRGQTLGFVEQLGTHVPVEAPQAGELVMLHVEDGAPVEYAQLVAELAPFFGGHIIGDRKYA